MTLSLRRLAGLFAPVLLLTTFACHAPPRAPAVIAGDPLVKPRLVGAGALRAGAQGDAEVAAFYTARRWRAAWTPTSADTFERLVDNALAHGIDPARFKAMIDSQDPAGRELDLTRAALAYADAMAHGLADPTKLFDPYAIEVNAVDTPQGLADALAKGHVGPWLESLPPQDAEYHTLSEAYLRYRTLASQPQAPEIPTGRLLHPGAHDARIPQIAARLRAFGYLPALPAPSASDPAPPAPVDTTYSPQIVEAMKAYQTDQGLNDDGIVGDDAIALLNAGPDDRARQIALNLEARRWLPRQVSGDRIDVNLPAAFLTLYRGGEVIDRRRVVVGKPDTATPHLAGSFKQLVVNPPWNVPDGIAKAEILPKGDGYLRSQNMTYENGRVVQQPGPGSALGLVKFDMQNRHAIYLHDTPSKSAFTRNERYLSHGCVRVDGAVDFAREIAEAFGKLAEFDEKLAANTTATVELGADIPVRLLYHTVFLSPDQRLVFRPDPYGWDAQLAQALGMPAPMQRGVASGSAGSLGP